MLSEIKWGQGLPWLVPEPLIGHFRGADKDKGQRMQITVISVIRLAVALGIGKCVSKMKADPTRVSMTFGGLLSAPGAGLYWGGRLLQRSVQDIRKGFADRAFGTASLGAAKWVGGCFLIQVTQTDMQYNGYRWGALEILNQRLSKDIEYRGVEGY
jgi:hypothetical protein